MDTAYQMTLILTGLFLVVLNGFFVASEFSIVKIRQTRIEELMQQGTRRAARAHILVQNMNEYLSATQLGITLASLGLGWIGEPAFSALFVPIFARFGSMQPVLTHSLSATSAFLLITFLHIVLGELAPKSLAIQQAERVVLRISRPLIFFYHISYPFIWILNASANLFLRLFGVRPASGGDRVHSEQELRLIITQSQKKGVIDREEKRILERVFDFADRSVRQVMVPSPEVVFLDLQETVEENLKLARAHRHTRYPLCNGAFDQLVGVVHVKELFWEYHRIGSQFDLASVSRPVQFVPDSKPIKILLTEFRQTRVHLAVVVDEHGTTVGIVTMEDILEELVGEIQDEFDIEVPSRIRKIDEHHYIVHGRTLLEELQHTLGITIDDEENDTIGGHIMMQLGRTAKVGDRVALQGGFQVRVVGMQGLQITDLAFEKVGGQTG